MKKLRPAFRVLLYLATMLLAAASIVNTIQNSLPDWAAMALYASAAAALFFSCFYGVNDMKYLIRHIIRPGIEGNALTHRLSKDYHYRTLFFSKFGFGISAVFAVFNGIVAVISISAWYAVLAVYYIFLVVLRFEALHYNRIPSQSPKRARLEWKLYFRCGILFIPMSLALGGAVFLMVRFGNSKSYPGTWIYAVAAYTFWKITISIINLVKAGKTRSPLLMVIRNVGYIDALVSMLSLQTALLEQFSVPGQQPFINRMNTISGIVICLMVMLLGIQMIWRSIGQNAVNV